MSKTPHPASICLTSEGHHYPELAEPAPPAPADQSFFANPSISDLMAASGVQPLTDPSVLIGGIPEDEDVDAMLKDIYDARGRGAPAAQETAPGDWLWAHPDYEKWKQDSHIRFDWGEVVALMREYSDSRTASLRADLEILADRADLEKMRADIAEEKVTRLQEDLKEAIALADGNNQKWLDAKLHADQAESEVARLEKERDEALKSKK